MPPPRTAEWNRLVTSRFRRSGSCPRPATSAPSRSGWRTTARVAVDLMNRYSSQSSDNQRMMNYWTPPPHVVVETVVPGAGGGAGHGAGVGAAVGAADGHRGGGPHHGGSGTAPGTARRCLAHPEPGPGTGAVHGGQAGPAAGRAGAGAPGTRQRAGPRCCGAGYCGVPGARPARCGRRRVAERRSGGRRTSGRRRAPGRCPASRRAPAARRGLPGTASGQSGQRSSGRLGARPGVGLPGGRERRLPHGGPWCRVRSRSGIGPLARPGGDRSGIPRRARRPVRPAHDGRRPGRRGGRGPRLRSGLRRAGRGRAWLAGGRPGLLPAGLPGWRPGRGPGPPPCHLPRGRHRRLRRRPLVHPARDQRRHPEAVRV